MNKSLWTRALILGVVGAIACAGTPGWAKGKAKKPARVAAAAAAPAPAATSVPGSAMMTPPPVVKPIFPPAPAAPAKK